MIDRATKAIDALPDSQIDLAVADIIDHEKSIQSDGEDLWYEVKRFQGIPMNTNRRIDQSPFLWIWQEGTKYHKPGMENAAQEGVTDLVFIIAQYIPLLDDGSFREDIIQRKNKLVKKFESTLIDKIHTDAPPDGMTYDTSKWWFLSSGMGYGDMWDIEKFYHAPMIFPYTGKPVPDGWFISVLTSTMKFVNK